MAPLHSASLGLYLSFSVYHYEIIERLILFTPSMLPCTTHQMLEFWITFPVLSVSPLNYWIMSGLQDGQYLRPSDPAYEQVLDSLAMVARHTPVPLLEALLRWRERCV